MNKIIFSFVVLLGCFIFLACSQEGYASDPFQSDVSSAVYSKLQNASNLMSDEVSYDIAEKELLILIEANVGYFNAYYQIGMLYIKKEDYIKADLYLDKANKIRKEKKLSSSGVLNALGWVKFKLSQYDKALSFYEQALEGKSSNSSELNGIILTNVGLLYHTLGKYEEANKHLKEAAEKFNSESAKDLIVQEMEVERKIIEKLLHKKISLTAKQGDYIGQRVWLNETGGKEENLVNWNQGEGHASIGIGNFIWYPKDKKGPYIESFPLLISYIALNNVSLPDWLNYTTECVWPNRDEMLEARRNGDSKYKQLLKLMKETTKLQIDFMVSRFTSALPKILQSLRSEDERELILRKYYMVSHDRDDKVSTSGVYALLDYVNFKGEGTDEKERYNGEGWGLLQVLQGMREDKDDPIGAFVESAKRVLARRIVNSQPSRNEKQWLRGWENRLDTYNQSLLESKVKLAKLEKFP